MKTRQVQIKELINKYLEGKLSEDECQIINDWLREDKKNIAFFRNYAEKYKPADTEGLNKSWKEFHTKLRIQDTLGSYQSVHGSWGEKVIRISRRQFFKYAAVFIVGLLFTGFVAERLINIAHEKSEKDWVYAETRAGEKTKLILPDSSLVWLNSESRISFPSDFSRRKKRIVKLEGEAFFDVAKQGRKNFIVSCEDYDVMVRGTKFNVMAYKDFNRTETTLAEGAVTVVRGSNSLDILPGERVIFSGKYLMKSKAQVRQAILWKDNKFYFDNIPFRELARRLERWYDVNISLNDPALNDIYYSGYFKNEETVWQVLDVIQMTTPIIYEHKQHREIAIDLK